MEAPKIRHIISKANIRSSTRHVGGHGDCTGPTGLGDDVMEAARAAAAKSPILLASNLSYGVAVLKHLAREALKFLADTDALADAAAVPAIAARVPEPARVDDAVSVREVAGPDVHLIPWFNIIFLTIVVLENLAPPFATPPRVRSTSAVAYSRDHRAPARPTRRSRRAARTPAPAQASS